MLHWRTMARNCGVDTTVDDRRRVEVGFACRRMLHFVMVRVFCVRVYMCAKKSGRGVLRNRYVSAKQMQTNSSGQPARNTLQQARLRRGCDRRCRVVGGGARYGGRHQGSVVGTPSSKHDLGVGAGCDAAEGDVHALVQPQAKEPAHFILEGLEASGAR